jgi:hypothetical protein
VSVEGSNPFARSNLFRRTKVLWGHTRIGYDTAKLEEAREFLKTAKEFKGDAYQADAVNLVLQAIANRGLNVYRQIVSARKEECPGRGRVIKTWDTPASAKWAWFLL